MNFENKNVQGYVFLKPFNGIYLPTNIQNLIIKNFCDQNGFKFNLSVNEHNINNCWMELFSIVRKKSVKVIVMTSIYMLPQNKKDFEKLLNYLKIDNKEFYFIFENQNAKNFNQLKLLQKKYKSYKVINKYI